MDGFRGFLIGLANLILVLLVVAAPALTFVLAGNMMPQWNGNFNVGAAFGAAIATFVAALPVAAILALFLDIREQLVAINTNTRASRANTDGIVTAAATLMQPACPSAEAPADPEAEMQIWFMKTHGRGITPAQARQLVQSKREGRFLTAVVELKAKL